MTTPATVKERRLVDDVDTPPHRRLGLGRGRTQLVTNRRRRAVTLDLDDVPAGGTQLIEVAPLMREPAPGDELDRRIVAHRLLDQPGQGRSLQREPMRAGKEADQVRRRIDGPAVDQLHM